jgi:hypothetical protein
MHVGAHLLDELLDQRLPALNLLGTGLLAAQADLSAT